MRSDEDSLKAMAAAVRDAFPEYRAYNVAQVLEAEVRLREFVSSSLSKSIEHCIEDFAGQGELSASVGEAGLRVQKIDRAYSWTHEILFPTGFRRRCVAMRFLCDDGLTWTAPECGSWLWLTRTISKRTNANPMGDNRVSMVAEANDVSIRVAFMMLLAHVSSTCYVMEKPHASMIHLSTHVKDHMLSTCVCKISTR